jgi:glucose/mannose transport system permease protein
MTAVRQGAPGFSLGRFADIVLPKLVIAPTVLTCLIGFYGFIAWTAWLSFTKSRLLPKYDWAGFLQYDELFHDDRWWHSMHNLATFGILFVGISMLVGLAMAVLLDQKIRGEGVLRTVYLYPMALSFIVTGTAWKWILNPGLGLEKMVHDWGFSSFTFDWLINPDTAIYTVVIAGVWQSSGFVMALFLAGLRGVDDSIIKAAQLDGASMPRIYLRIIIPSLRPVFLSAFMILAHIAVKSFDLVMALTGGGPGFATDLPSIYMYQHGFTRGQLGLGAASAMMMLATAAAVVMPLLYSELRRDKRG